MIYSDVISSALNYSDRGSDQDITSVMDLFISIVESRINTYLATQKMAAVSTTPLVANQVYYALPSDYLSMRSLKLTTTATPAGYTTLSYLNPEQMDVQSNVDHGLQTYTIIGNNILISPASIDTAQLMQLSYYLKLPNLNGTATSNWLSSNFPHVYIFGLMVEISSYVKDGPATIGWEQRFMSALDEVKQQDKLALTSGAPLITRVG